MRQLGQPGLGVPARLREGRRKGRSGLPTRLRLDRSLNARTIGRQWLRLCRLAGLLLGAHSRRATGRIDLELHARVLGALKKLRALRGAEAEAAQVEQQQGGMADGEGRQPPERVGAEPVVRRVQLLQGRAAAERLAQRRAAAVPDLVAEMGCREWWLVSVDCRT